MNELMNQEEGYAKSSPGPEAQKPGGPTHRTITDSWVDRIAPLGVTVTVYRKREFEPARNLNPGLLNCYYSLHFLRFKLLKFTFRTH